VVEQNRFGTVVPGGEQPPAPPYGVPAPPPYPGGYALTPYGPPPPAGLSTGAKVAIGLAIAAGSFVVICILAAIAIPVFLNQQAKAIAARTSVSLPDTVGGDPRLPESAQVGVRSLAAQIPAEGHAQAAVYGRGTTATVVVIVGSHALNAKDQSDYLAAVDDSEAKNAGVVEAKVPAGPLGGTVQCGASPDGRRTDCAFVDAGAFGVIDVLGTGPDAQRRVLSIRSEVEHRS
jgi:hypothetical protein